MKKEGQNVLEFLNLKFMIVNRLFPGNVENGHFDQKTVKHNERERRTNKLRKTREKTESLIVTIKHDKTLN